MAVLATRAEWKEDALVKRFIREIQPQLEQDALQLQPLMTINGEHRVPSALWERVRANFAA